MKIKEKSSLACIIVKSNKAVPKVCPFKKKVKKRKEKEEKEREKESI